MYREIYLDNSATTRPFDEVIEYMTEINRNFYGNPSSMHLKGIEAERKLNEARDIIANTLTCSSQNIIFTSGGTEANNLAIKGYLECNPRKGKHIITTSIEHPAVLEVIKQMVINGYRADYLRVDNNGILDIDELIGKITDETSFVSIMLVNNEMGAIEPLSEAIAAIKSKNPQIIIHVDAVQAYGKIKLTPSKMGIDLMSISSHKINGPKGTGVLFAAKNIKLKPLFYGGGQEALMRSGTENVPGICGFGLAADITCRMLEKTGEHVGKLKSSFIKKLTKARFKCKVISGDNTSPYILSAAFEGLKSEVLLHHLEERKIYVSAGSACSSRKKTRSHVLKAMNLPDSIIDSAIRFSFSSFNREEDIEEAFDALSDIVPRLQKNTDNNMPFKYKGNN